MSSRGRYSLLKLLILGLLGCLLLASGVSAREKGTARLERIGDYPTTDIRLRPTLAAAETCSVSQNQELVYRIDSWVVGYELYKSLMNPALSCTQPYPYTITEVNMPMAFDATCTFTVSVDVEAVDNTTYPGCPVPGVLLGISTDYTLTIPAGGGLYNLWIPLDSPVVVNGPFFAGFYLGSEIDAAVGAAVLVDTFPVPCATYNIWDTTIGYIDLTDNSYYNFPGRLAMEVTGTSGGGGGGTTQPAPQISLVSPTAGQTLMGSVDLWAAEISGSTIIDYVSFSYVKGAGSYVEIGRDYDGTAPLRNGSSLAESGNGYSLAWNFGALTEGTYTIKATVVDTLGRSATAQATVYLEPTPPLPTITSPHNGADFCTPISFLMTCPDENMSYIDVYRKPAQLVYSAGMAMYYEHSSGDKNGVPSDGNWASNGEYGDYYCGPVAAAISAKYWSDKGFPNIMKLNGAAAAIGAVTESLAVALNTRARSGTTDEAMVSGLRTYVAAHGNDLTVDFLRKPDYFTLRAWAEDEQRAVMVGLGGTPGVWATVDGFDGWKQGDGSYTVMVSNPITGTIQGMPMRDLVGQSEMFYDGDWHSVDIIVSLAAKTFTVTRTLTGYDSNGNDGWSFSWTPTGFTEDNPYFFRFTGRDATTYKASTTFLGLYNCSQVYAEGDYNADAAADVLDLIYLIDFISKGGPAPAGGVQRADANCDNTVNVADIVFYMNFLFGAAGSPCH